MPDLLVSAHTKHAVVFMDQDDNGLRFVNNRHPATLEPDELTLTSAEVLSRTDPHVCVAMLAHITPEPGDLKPVLTAFMNSLVDYRRGHGGVSADVLRPAAAGTDEYALPAFLLDALTMMRQIHEELLADKLAQLLKALLHAVRSAAEGTLKSLLPIDDFMCALEDYEALITAKRDQSDRAHYDGRAIKNIPCDSIVASKLCPPQPG